MCVRPMFALGRAAAFLKARKIFITMNGAIFWDLRFRRHAFHTADFDTVLQDGIVDTLNTCFTM